MRPLLAVKNLNVSLYKRPILHDVNFEIMPHQVFILMGPSGAGKSTIMRTVSGLLGEKQNAIVSGQIHYDGSDIRPDHAPTMVIQTARMLLGTVFDNLSESFPKRGSFTHEELRQEITQFLCKLDLVELADSLDIQVLDLDKVQRKKLLIANALLQKPALIALDEPTADLDEVEASILLEFIETLTDQCTIMMITSNQDRARVIGDVVCLVAGGHIQEIQPVDKFFYNPKSQAARDFVLTGQCTASALIALSEHLKSVDIGDINSEEMLEEFLDIELFPLHDGPTTEPDYGSPLSVSSRQAPEFEHSFIGDRPKTLTSNPIHTESNDDILTVNEIPFNDDNFAVIEDLSLNKESKLITRLTRRFQQQTSKNTNEMRGPRDFRWLRHGVLAGTPQPGLLVDIKQDLSALKRVGVTHLITLTEEPMKNTPFQEFGIHNVHFPIVDMEAPSLKNTAEICAALADLIERNATIAYHCHAGIGRTGTMLVAQLIWEGLDAQTALNQARSVFSPWVQSKTQEDFLIEFQNLIRP